MFALALATTLLAQTPFDDREVNVEARKAPTKGTVVLSGKVTQWVGGSPTSSPKEKPLSGATVVVGDLTFSTGNAGTDTIKGKVVAKVVTDEKGQWTANVPAGKYSVVLWKAGYTPQTDSNVAAPGTHEGSLSEDRQGQGLHRSLSFN